MTASMSEQQTSKFSNGPIHCSSWCEEGDGHASAKFAADQWCRSIEGKVTVSLSAPWEMVDGSITPAQAVVYAGQDAGEAPHVGLVNHQDQSMDLTPAEARELARQLRHFAWVAEQDAQKRNAFEIGRDTGRLLDATGGMPEQARPARQG